MNINVRHVCMCVYTHIYEYIFLLGYFLTTKMYRFNQEKINKPYYIHTKDGIRKEVELHVSK